MITYENIFKSIGSILLFSQLVLDIFFIVVIILSIILKYNNKILSIFKIISKLLFIVAGIVIVSVISFKIVLYLKQKSIVKNNEIVITFSNSSIFNTYYDTYLINKGKIEESEIEVKNIKSNYIIGNDSCDNCNLGLNDTIKYSISNNKRYFYVIDNNNLSLYEYYKDTNRLELVLKDLPYFDTLKYFNAK